MINYPKNVIFIVFLSSNLLTERFHSTAIIPQPFLRRNCNPITIIPTPSLASKCVSLKKTYTLFHCNYHWINFAIFGTPCTLLPLWRSGHRHWKRWSGWKLKIYPHFLFCPSRVSSVLPPPPPRSTEEVSEGEGGRWPEIVCSSDGSQVLQLTNLQLVKW